MKTFFGALILILFFTHSNLFASSDSHVFIKSFDAKKGDLTSTGSNPYFILEPGHQWIYKGKEHGKQTVLKISVLEETKTVDGVKTRVVEEKEIVDGKLVEVSRNYFAISKKTKDVFYFGEAVDIYKGNKIVHEGAWLAGEKGAKFGLIMPAKPAVGVRFYQELAPQKAMDRAEVVSLNETVTTPAGKFKKCLKIKETSALEDGMEFKLYAPGVGLIQDGDLQLVEHRKK